MSEKENENVSWATIPDAADQCGRAVVTVWRWAKKNLVRSRKTGVFNRIQVSVDDCRRMADEHSPGKSKWPTTTKRAARKRSRSTIK